ncbi:MAG: right-handed parallel beta-helix repeat-containing protein [Planctomycetaceae bacterium]
MRASFALFLFTILLVVMSTADRASAEYPYTVPELPPLEGMYASAPPMSYDPNLTVPGEYGPGPGDDYLSDQYPVDDFGGDVGPGGYPIDDPVPGFETVFANGAPIWVGHIASLYMPGTERAIWNGELFLPLWQDGRNLWFFNMRGQVDDKDAGEFNVGSGFRTMAWPGWVFGSYLFYDRLNSSNDNGYSQATLGVEAMDVFWDFRFNVYFPESKAKAVSTPPSATISNGTVVVNSGVERAYWGVDFETGALLWSWGPNADHELRGFVGFYHFDHSEPGFDSITGPRARMEWRAYDLPYFGNGSRFTCGFSVQADSERGGDASVFAGLRIPLDPWANARRPLSQLQRRMLDSVVRDVDVVTNVVGRSEAAINTNTGRVIQSVRTLQNGDNLANEIPDAGEDSLVVIDGTDGDIYSTSSVNLETGQMVIGGGMQIAVVGERTGLPATFTAPGKRPNIEFGAATSSQYHTPPAGFVMADQTFLKGINIRSGKPAVWVNHADDVTIDDVYIRDSDGAGIAIQNANHVDIDHVTIDEVNGPRLSGAILSTEATYESAPLSQGSGIFAVNSKDISIRNSSIRETDGPGISLRNTEDVTIENVNIEGVRHDYEYWYVASPPADVLNPGLPPVIMWAPNRTGIELMDTTNTSISQVSIKSYGTFGIWGNRVADTSIDQVSIRDVSKGIFLRDASGFTQITNSQITDGTSETGIEVTNLSSDPLDLLISENMIDNQQIKLKFFNETNVTARLVENEIGGDGMSVEILGSGTGTSSIGLFDNQLKGMVDVTASGERVLNLVLQDNNLTPGSTPHSITSQDDASIYLLYGGNSSSSQVIFENDSAFFGVEPFTGNNHSPTLMGNFDTLTIGTLQSRAPALFE